MAKQWRVSTNTSSVIEADSEEGAVITFLESLTIGDCTVEPDGEGDEDEEEDEEEEHDEKDT